MFFLDERNQLTGLRLALSTSCPMQFLLSHSSLMMITLPFSLGEFLNLCSQQQLTVCYSLSFREDAVKLFTIISYGKVAFDLLFKVNFFGSFKQCLHDLLLVKCPQLLSGVTLSKVLHLFASQGWRFFVFFFFLIYM